MYRLSYLNIFLCSILWHNYLLLNVTTLNYLIYILFTNICIQSTKTNGLLALGLNITLEEYIRKIMYLSICKIKYVF